LQPGGTGWGDKTHGGAGGDTALCMREKPGGDNGANPLEIKAVGRPNRPSRGPQTSFRRGNETFRSEINSRWMWGRDFGLLPPLKAGFALCRPPTTQTPKKKNIQDQGGDPRSRQKKKNPLWGGHKTNSKQKKKKKKKKKTSQWVFQKKI